MFTTEFGTPVDRRNLLWVIETAVKTAGVDGVGIHIVRHSAAVAWLESGVHIKEVADARERRSSLFPELLWFE